jgi:hypothetical protein
MRANVQRFGSAGGLANACRAPSGNTSAGYVRLSTGSASINRRRESAVSRSALISPRCGV